ncbi:uncharacterized protein [Branchiostoma lanceolatum]|uniref:uncharacterized protein n=1 Tax=Branchiostoma lanceolatum TaxID=7740 RepID=UPI003456EC00
MAAQDVPRRYFFYIKQEVASRWKDLAECLGVENSSIRNIDGRNRDDRSRCMDLLQEWKMTRGEAATTEALMQALSDAGLREVLVKLKNRFPELATVIEQMLSVMQPCQEPIEQPSRGQSASSVQPLQGTTEQPLHLTRGQPPHGQPPHGQPPHGQPQSMSWVQPQSVQWMQPHPMSWLRPQLTQWGQPQAVPWGQPQVVPMMWGQPQAMAMGQPQQPMAGELTPYFNYIAANMAVRWPQLAANLGLQFAQIQAIKQENHNDSWMCCQQILHMWQSYNGREAKVEGLIQAVKETGHQDVAQELEIMQIDCNKKRDSC